MAKTGGWFCLLFLGLAALLPGKAQRYWTNYYAPLNFEAISVEQGLSQSSVLCICQDSQGFLWFGTEDGLNKYNGYNFTVYRHNSRDANSLGSSLVYCIVEDRQETLWIGTHGGGLQRFDREKNRFYRFQNDPDDESSLSNNDVNCLLRDLDGALWVGTDGGGLNRGVADPNNGTWRFSLYSADPANPRSLGGNFITAICQDHQGVLWIGSNDGGLCRLDGAAGDQATTLFTRFPAGNAANPTAVPERVTSIAEDGQGQLWIGTQNGLFRFNRGRGTFTRFMNDPADTRSLSHDYVRFLYSDRAGVLWVGTDGGGLNKVIPGDRPGSSLFIRYLHDDQDPLSLSGNAVESICEDRSGVLWIGLYYGGLNKLILNKGSGYEREKRQFIHYRMIPFARNGLSHNAVNAIYEDSRGILWICTDGGGLNRVSAPAHTTTPLLFTHYRAEARKPTALNDDVVTAICEDHSGDLWIGTYTGGLNRLDRNSIASLEPVFSHYRYAANDPGSLSSDFVMALHEDNRNTLWVGTVDGGLNRLDRATNRFVNYRYRDDDPYCLSDDSVFAIGEDRAGELWIGTSDGLNRHDRQNDRFTHYVYDENDTRSLSGNFIRTIFEDSDGNLWIGTDGAGLNRCAANRSRGAELHFTRFTVENGLPSNVILGILEDDHGYLWLSSSRGLTRFDPRTGACRNYDKKDGLQSNEFHRGAYCRSRSGEMFFGGYNGFNVFFPDDISENPHVPPIVIIDFNIFNRSVPIDRPQNGRTILQRSISQTSHIELSYRDYVFSFEYAALHFVSPEKNEYAYMMQGLERSWNFVGQRRFVTYTTLPPGEYVFRVKGCNSDGLWNEKGVALRITIKPPFWKTVWFYLLCALTVAFSVFGTYQWRVRQMKKREVELEALVEERTHELEKTNQQLALANRDLRRLATKDALTGIANIRRFYDILHREWRRALRHNLPLSLILIDVDYFKLYNDTYGHQAGDESLRKVARTLNHFARRPGDIAARYGGEEFVLLLSELDSEGAALQAEKIRLAICRLEILHEKSDIASNLTISLGCASMVPQEKLNFQMLLKKADDALYRSKQSGRNRVTVA